MDVIFGTVGLCNRESAVMNILRGMGAGEDAFLYQKEDVFLLQSDNRDELGTDHTPYQIVMDGELYNRSEVERKLGKTCLSDRDAVLASFIKWGTDCLLHLDGGFSFAIWNERKREIFLARDRMGIKPLYYTSNEKNFAFANRLSALLAHPQIPAELDDEGIAQLFLLGPGRKQSSGILKNINALEPGSCGIWREGIFRTDCYWMLKDREHRENFTTTCDHVRELVTDSILRQMKWNGNWGTFLSGGLDSSIISAVCAAQLQGENLHTFSVDYENQTENFTPNRLQPTNDQDFITLMTEKIGASHCRTVLKPENLAELLEDAMVAREFPGMGDIDSSLLGFFQDVRKQISLGLSGECADEIFGGYPWYRDPEIRAQEGFPWAQNTRQRIALLHPDVRKNIDGEEFVRSCYEETMEKADVLPGTSQTEMRMKELVVLNQYWFMQTLLERNRTMSEAAGITVRAPFCDYRIAEYLYSVPWEMKDYHGREKGLLREAFRDSLPDAIYSRKKSPYPKTYDPRYEKIVRDMLRAVLADSSQPIHGVIDRKTAENILNAAYSEPWYGQLMRIPQMMAYLLQVNMWLKHFKITIC